MQMHDVEVFYSSVPVEFADADDEWIAPALEAAKEYGAEAVACVEHNIEQAERYPEGPTIHAPGWFWKGYAGGKALCRGPFPSRDQAQANMLSYADGTKQ